MFTNENSPGANPGAISPELTTTTSNHHSTDGYADYIRGLHQRRAASRRIPPLVCGHVDPWTCDHKTDPTEAQVDGAAAAGAHLRSLGFAPVFPVTMCRALYRRGYRELASELGTRWVA